jgi:hypothetical protein
MEAMNVALTGGSPYAGATITDVDDLLLGASGNISSFVGPFTYMTSLAGLNFDTLFSTYKNSGALADYVNSKAARLTAINTAESNLLSDDINAVTLPQFRSGLRDIGMVMSSAFVIGEANIWASKTKALAKNDAIIRWEAEKLQASLVTQLDAFAMGAALAQFEIKKNLVSLTSDLARLYTTMKHEAVDSEMEYIAKDRLWDIKVFQYGGNFLGSIAGSAVSVDKGEGSKTGSTVAMGAVGAYAGYYAGLGVGALTGAEAGSAAGPIGAVAGAVVGGVVGYFSS